MAILDRVPGLVVTIGVAGQDIIEYHDADEQEPQPLTHYAYVQAQSGAKFGIATKFDASAFPYANDTIYFRLYLDGTFICNWERTPTSLRSGMRRLMDHVGMELGDRTVLREFSFAELNIGIIPSRTSRSFALDPLTLCS